MRRLRRTAHDLGLLTIERLICDVELSLREADLALLRDATAELLDDVTHVQVVTAGPNRKSLADNVLSASIRKSRPSLA